MAKRFYFLGPDSVVVYCKVALLLAAAASFPAAALADDRVLLESREVKITSQDFDTEIARIPEENRAEVLASRERIRKILEGLLIDKTLAMRARNEGLDRDPEVARKILRATNKVLADAQLDRMVNATVIPDFDGRARELYQANPENYTTPEMVHVSHILVGFKGRSPDEALKRVQEVRTLALNGKDFGELALEYSDDPSAQKNKGDLGFFEAKTMVVPFSKAAFAMNTPGEISEPVKTQYGYHIIQFHEKQSGELRPFEKVKDSIVKNLRAKYLSETRNSILAAIVNDPSLKMDTQAVESYRTTLDFSAASAVQTTK